MLKQESYTYDHKNLRIKKEEYKEDSVRKTYYVYSGNDILFTETYIDNTPVEMRFNLADMVSYTYHYGDDPKEELNYYYKDHRQNRIVKTEDDGSIISSANKFGYSSWGELDNPEATEESWFTGKKQDSTGLYYFNARYYDSEMGRFLQEDSIRSGKNWYTYCSNNPINHSDPTGLYDPDDPERGNGRSAQGYYGSEPKDANPPEEKWVNPFEGKYFKSNDPRDVWEEQNFSPEAMAGAPARLVGTVFTMAACVGGAYVQGSINPKNIVRESLERTYTPLYRGLSKSDIEQIQKTGGIKAKSVTGDSLTDADIERHETSYEASPYISVTSSSSTANDFARGKVNDGKKQMNEPGNMIALILSPRAISIQDKHGAAWVDAEYLIPNRIKASEIMAIYPSVKPLQFGSISPDEFAAMEGMLK